MGLRSTRVAPLNVQSLVRNASAVSFFNVVTHICSLRDTPVVRYHPLKMCESRGWTIRSERSNGIRTTELVVVFFSLYDTCFGTFYGCWLVGYLRD